MFNSKYKQAYKEALKLLDEIEMNLANNYKDNSWAARKTAEARIKELREEGLLKDKDYGVLVKKLEEYDKRMEGYSHRLKLNF